MTMTPTPAALTAALEGLGIETSGLLSLRFGLNCVVAEYAPLYHGVRTNAGTMVEATYLVEAPSADAAEGPGPVLVPVDGAADVPDDSTLAAGELDPPLTPDELGVDRVDVLLADDVVLAVDVQVVGRLTHGSSLPSGGLVAADDRAAGAGAGLIGVAPANPDERRGTVR